MTNEINQTNEKNQVKENNKAIYFPHFTNTLLDAKIIKLRRKLKNDALSGYAIYFILLERLSTSDNYQIEYNSEYLEDLAFDLRCSEKLLKSVIEDFDLFKVENGVLFSEALKRNMQYKDNKKKKSSTGGRKAASNMTEEQRKERAKNAAKARYNNTAPANPLLSHLADDAKSVSSSAKSLSSNAKTPSSSANNKNKDKNRNKDIDKNKDKNENQLAVEIANNNDNRIDNEFTHKEVISNNIKLKSFENFITENNNKYKDISIPEYKKYLEIAYTKYNSNYHPITTPIHGNDVMFKKYFESNISID